MDHIFSTVVGRVSLDIVSRDDGSLQILIVDSRDQSGSEIRLTGANRNEFVDAILQSFNTPFDFPDFAGRTADGDKDQREHLPCDCCADHVGYGLDGATIVCSCGATLDLSIEQLPVCVATCIDPDGIDEEELPY